MIPETDFHKRGNLMFALIEGRYYTASNSADAEKDFLSLCGLRFPLFKGRTLADEEKSYVKRNIIALGKRKEELEVEMASSTSKSDVNQRFLLAGDINYFLKNICLPLNKHLSVRPYQYQKIDPSFEIINLEEEIPPIFPKLIERDYAVLNGRLYQINENKEPFLLDVDGKRYMSSASQFTVDDIETKYNQEMDSELRKIAMKSSDKIKRLGEALWNIEMENEQLIQDLKISKYPYCYEHGELGFDISSRVVYCLMPPHSNANTGRSYGYGQSAGTLPLSNKVLGTSPKFAERENANYAFSINSGSVCTGDLTLDGDTLEDKMIFLKKFALEVADNGAFYIAPASSDDSSSYS